jgi:asparagine synthase (glutamine-hydrolysing)
MCGICGYWLEAAVGGSERLQAMMAAQRQRGPDGSGFALVDSNTWGHRECELGRANSFSPDGRVSPVEVSFAHDIGLGHVRFAIIDLSPGGGQPFWAADRSACLCFNGEIYNYLELRGELEGLGHQFRTQSDTEVLLAAFMQWGERCVTRLNGFWAFAILDLRAKRVFLSRDRIGVAPLYYCVTREGVFWASEIKAVLAAMPGVRRAVNTVAVRDFVAFGLRDVSDETFYEGVRKMPAGTNAWLSKSGPPQLQRYYELPGPENRMRDIGDAEAIVGFRNVVSNAVGVRLRADVPVGFELSGGLDSSMLVRLVAARGNPVAAYTASFGRTAADEAPFARVVVGSFRGGVSHHIISPGMGDFLEVANAFVWQQEEPFHSPVLQTNQAIWQEMAADGIRVSINGGCADELLGGYADVYVYRYIRYLIHNCQLKTAVLEVLLNKEYGETWFGLGRTRLLMKTIPFLEKLGLSLRRSIPRWMDPLAGCDEVPLATRVPADEVSQFLLDLMGPFLMNYWLSSANKAFMGVPIEVRYPFLDYNVVDYAFRLPLRFLWRDGWLKWIQRKAIGNLLPDEIVWRRRKVGFAFPYGEWLAAHEEVFTRFARECECPFVDAQKLATGYRWLARWRPTYLWRVISTSLWWWRCVRGETLPSRLGFGHA